MSAMARLNKKKQADISKNKRPGTAQIMWLLDENGTRFDPVSSPHLTLAKLRTRRGQSIATLHVQYPGATTTIIFSHGNATDLGAMRDRLIDYSQQLMVNVFAYDYTGYGQSSGRPTAANTYADAEAALHHVVETYKPLKIICYGQSLGSGLSIYLGKKYPELVSGILLQCGFMSGLRVLNKGSHDLQWFDIYPNIENMRETKAPVMIIHGTADEDVPIIHAYYLFENTPNPYKPWYIEGAGHNNIERDWRYEFYTHVSKFVRDVEAGIVVPLPIPAPKSTCRFSIFKWKKMKITKTKDNQANQANQTNQTGNISAKYNMARQMTMTMPDISPRSSPRSSLQNVRPPHQQF
jgi:pimeloyl-ACP methyl ester carboxylesterase